MNFPLRDILTVTTGRLLTKPESENDNGIGALYKILEHMTGEPPFTHTLGRFAEECKPLIIAKYPEFDSPELQFKIASLDGMLKTESGSDSPSLLIEGWISGLVRDGLFKSEYELGRIATHERKSPVDDLHEMMN